MIHVAMGFIYDEHGHVLIAKRNLKKDYGGLWEFPGGKLEDNETASQAIVRELKEELAIEVSVKEEFSPYVFKEGAREITFYPIECEILSGNLNNLEHEEVRFVSRTSVKDFAFAPPDYEALKLVA